MTTGNKRAPLSKRDTVALREVIKHLMMETCSFSQIYTPEDDRLPKSEAEVTEFIRRRTHLWRESWILPVLREMVERGEKGK